MIQLGATVLNINLTWPDRDYTYQVEQERRRTLGGSQVVWSQQASGGRPITLVAVQDQGWLTKAQKDAVYAMAAVSGGQFTLVIGVDSFNVVFRHDEAPAVEFSPLISRAVDLVEDYFVGTIKLVTL